jgi:hypothetical protein
VPLNLNDPGGMDIEEPTLGTTTLMTNKHQKSKENKEGIE